MYYFYYYFINLLSLILFLSWKCNQMYFRPSHSSFHFSLLAIFLSLCSAFWIIYSDLSSHSQILSFTVSNIYFISIRWGFFVCLFVCFGLRCHLRIFYSLNIFSRQSFISLKILSVFCPVIVISQVFASQSLLSPVPAGSCLWFFVSLGCGP